MNKMQQYLSHIDEAKLKKMIELRGRYTGGELSLEKVRELLRKEVGKITPTELAYAEQTLKEESSDECVKEDIQTVKDLFQDLLDTSMPELPKDHPISSYYKENMSAKKIVEEIIDLRKQNFDADKCLKLFDKLEDFKIHYVRKQNQLYSILERKGFDRPSTTMWTYDDMVRDMLIKQHKLLKEGDLEAFEAGEKDFEVSILDLMEKENEILFPTSLKMITENEFREMRHGDDEIGYCFIEKPTEFLPKPQQDKVADGFASELVELLGKYGIGGKKEEKDVMDVATGLLTLEQINLIFKNLPVDLSYVDENDIVKFYSDTNHRVFPRSKAAIGRQVRKCHPPKSVHIVEEIIEKFRSGKQDKAEFWINKPGFFVYIIYVAIRDENGKFRGILEMMQDCTRIRGLEGSRTLLTWGDENDVPETCENKTETHHDCGCHGDSSKSDCGCKEEESCENKTETHHDCGCHGDSSKSDCGCKDDYNGITFNEDTKIKELITKYPKLKYDMVEVDSKLKMLQTPFAKIMLPKATLGLVSKHTGKDLDWIIEKVKELIRRY